MPWCSQRELARLDRLIDDYKKQRDEAVYYMRVFANAFLKARKSTPMENPAPEQLKPPPKPEPPPVIEPVDLGEWNALIADQLDANPDLSINQAEAAVRKILADEGKLAPNGSSIN